MNQIIGATYSSSYSSLGSSSMLTSSAEAGIWSIIALVIAAIVALGGYFLFVKGNKLEAKGKFFAWLRKFLRFDIMWIEDIMKILYIFLAVFITLNSFALIGGSFLGFILTLVGGNLGLRILYEAVMMTIMIWRNTTEIKENTKKK